MDSLILDMEPSAALESSGPCLLLVDGHAYAYRAFHAIRHLNSPSGSPTNAIYGFIKMLARMQSSLAPTHQAVIWDGGLAAERMAELPGYKQQRPPMPDSLAAQIDALQHWLGSAGIWSQEEEGVEADDAIAALALRAAAAGVRVVIASADKDFQQLVSPRIGLFNPNDKSEKVWTPDDVAAKTGVRPEQVVDWLSLIGDAVDNIPGVPGVGPKTAAELLQQFGTIEGILARLPEVRSERLRAALASAGEVLRRNQRLIRLRDDLATPSLEELCPRVPDRETLRGLYAAWGFKSLLAEIEKTTCNQPELL
jgi:DNA polymerase-1